MEPSFRLEGMGVGENGLIVVEDGEGCGYAYLDVCWLEFSFRRTGGGHLGLRGSAKRGREIILRLVVDEIRSACPLWGLRVVKGPEPGRGFANFL